MGDLTVLVFLIDTISAILIARFLSSLRSIDLPQSNVPGEYSTSENGGSVWSSCLRFADQIRSFDVVANIGAPLDNGEEAEREYSGDIGTSEFHEDGFQGHFIETEIVQKA
ncbi:hypothetical protein NLI96_g10525 [Meripilus lineatus]|uniref:Uncharacterized protein n=1 Tax=Meripilus lineatus TaxID=2056292 RepID=A0AAD5UTR9_9APHY|nr:hypothetical protein NLI96_g10525 [Physisporinus lineatus]